jgi:hypothetical protein
MNLPDHLSASQIIKFLTCPLAYKFHYIDGVETGTKSSSCACSDTTWPNQRLPGT